MKKWKTGKYPRFDTFLGYIFDMADIYVKNRVPRSAAALSYFLTMSLFPVLICIHAMLAGFATDITSMIEGLSNVIPAGTIKTITDYFGYISGQDNTAILTAGLIVTATTSAAAFRTIHGIMADIQGAPRFEGFLSVVFSFVFSLLFLAAMYFAIIVMVGGNWLISLISDVVPGVANLGLWSLLRYPVLFVMFIFIIYGVYKINTPKDIRGDFFPGAISASVAIVLVSMLFSLLISMSSRYPLVYGSLASIIIFMLWMDICGQILIMGNALNVVLRRRKEQDGGDPPVFVPK